MKIGIDISQVVYKGSGVASYTQYLVKSLLEQSDHQFVLFGSAFGRQADLLQFMRTLPHRTSFSSKIVYLPPAVLSFLWNQLHIGSVERFAGPVDLFHTSDWTEPPAQSPKVTTIHDVVIYKYPQHLPEEIIETQKRKLFWVKKETAAIIADSQSTKKDIVEYLQISPEKVHVVYLGVEDIFFPQKIDLVTQVKQKYQIIGDYILCVGTREPRKNLTRTIAAFKKLSDHDYTLVIAGNFGWGEDIGANSRIKIIGYVENADLPALYTGAACFMYPSLYEGFGLPVLEALSCGTPVVTSNRGSLGEIADGIATEVNPEDVGDMTKGIERVLNLTQKQHKALSLKGIKHAEKFTWEQTAKKTLAVYKKIVAR